MSNTQMTKMERLQLVLDGYGADPSCWPQEDQVLLDFIKEEPAAKQLRLEAEALDRLLDLSVEPEQTPIHHMDLQQRILADFEELHVAKSDNVVTFPMTKTSVITGSFLENRWMTAAALAACFAFGMYLGGVGIGEWTLDPTTVLASLSGGEEQLAEIGDYVISSGLEEELL